MAKQIYEGSMDRRILHLKIRTGELKEEDLQEYLQGLPDLTANAEPLIIKEGKDGDAS
ncbi:MAG TPA: hypothetical protein PK175_09365 [Syntrophales bacterium]|jgi:hypothetical protein|nr:hypothetical protein [Syntrophales bacterium]HON23145.1 hypothetical protein [Syntrophales bacterium]HOU76871.1 hypothetical protein [Syntrophales bacterium]HPC31640.1 hypothetical protein [Syntrophales bacterium]HQG35068.1 hypothetical protein [Syntrophales bacterium]